MNNFHPGDRIRTPTDRLGTVQPAPWFMPYHVLIKLDNMDRPIWLLTSILTLEARAQPEPQPAVVQIAQLSLFSEDAAA